MAFAKDVLTGVGAQQTYNISFGSLKSAHIQVFIDDVLQADETYNSTRTQVTLVTVIAGGEEIVILRVTPRTEAGQLVDFNDGSILTEASLEDARLQTLYVVQEALDELEDTLQKDLGSTEWDATTLKITNVVDGVAAQDAVTKAQLDAAVIVAGNLPTVGAPDNDSGLAVVAGAWSKQTKAQLEALWGVDAVEASVLSVQNDQLTLGVFELDDNVQVFRSTSGTWNELAATRMGINTLTEVDPLGEMAFDGIDEIQLSAGLWKITIMVSLQNDTNSGSIDWKLTDDDDSATQVIYKSSITALAHDTLDTIQVTTVVHVDLTTAKNLCLRMRNGTLTANSETRGAQSVVVVERLGDT